MREFVEALARGEGNFFDGWMQNPMSAMISCNDGFRPFSFYIEVMVDANGNDNGNDNVNDNDNDNGNDNLNRNEK